MDIELSLDSTHAEISAQTQGMGLAFWSDRAGPAPGIALTVDRSTWETLGAPVTLTLTAPDPYPETEGGPDA